MNISTWMTDTIGVGRHVGNSIYGDREYELSAQVKARVEYKTEIFMTSDGTEGSSSNIVFTEYPIENDDRIWLPPSNFSNASESKPVKGVQMSMSKNGLKKLYKVFL